MATPLDSRYLTFSALFFVSLFSAAQLFETLDAANPPFSSFSFDRFHSLDPEIALYGDAEIRDSMVRMTRPAISSRGRIVYRKPIRFLGTKPGFSAYFAFSISPAKGDGLGLAFSLVPKSMDDSRLVFPPSILSVKYVTSRGANLIEIDLGGEVSIRSHDLSSINLVLNSGEKLNSWVDYNGESKRVEVRLSKSRDARPANSSISCPIDLSGVLWREAVFVGISSSSGNSTQTSSVYSWKLARRHGAPYSMHSEPLDPHSFIDKTREGPPIHLRRAYPWRILMALVFGTACGLLMVFAVLYIRAMFDRRPVVPVDYSEHPMESRDEKIVLVGDKIKDTAAK